MIVVVMGVSGSGKTTVAAALAGFLDWSLQDADDLHPQSNLDKMSAGVALTDADRIPWLHRVADWMDDQRAQGRNAVVACSALKRSYRDVLRRDETEGDVHFVLLDGPRETIESRLVARMDHFMPVSLLDSQFAVLEPPAGDERAMVVPIGRSSLAIARRLARYFG